MKKRGSRGSNAILGDVDVMVTISVNGDVRTVAITKANDAPEGVLFSFKSENHSFGTDEDGDPITVNVRQRANPSCDSIELERAKLHQTNKQSSPSCTVRARQG